MYNPIKAQVKPYEALRELMNKFKTGPLTRQLYFLLQKIREGFGEGGSPSPSRRAGSGWAQPPRVGAAGSDRLLDV